MFTGLTIIKVKSSLIVFTQMYLQGVTTITVTTVDIKIRQMIPRIPAMNFSGGDGEPAGREKETEKGVMGTVA